MMFISTKNGGNEIGFEEAATARNEGVIGVETQML